MANLGNLIVRGVTRILGDAYANKFIGNLQGNADTATSAIKASTADSATSATSANKASIATAVQDYGTSDYREIKIGYSGSGLSSSNIETAVGFTDNGTKIKDISKNEFRNWLATASGTWPITVSNATNSINADTLDGYHASYGINKPWGTIPVITNGGYMDVGKHFEFHYDNTTGSDYSTVLGCTGNYRNIVNLPSKNGTLALLTDNVASASKWATPRTITLTGSVTGSVSLDGSANVTLATTTNHTHTFASITSKPTTISGYGITDALTSKYITYKQDYQQYVILLCKIGTNTTNDQHTINGTFWTTVGGVIRYQAAYINVHCSDWTSWHNEYYGFTPFGLGTKSRLVTCTYQSSQYLAITFENIQATSIYFDGSYSNILFTPILYYTNNTSTIENSEIYNSITEVTYNKIPLISSAETALTSSNFNSYAPTLKGTGATGIWDISILGTADSASYASVLMSISKPNTDTVKYNKPFSYFVGQLTIGTAEGNAYEGSSSNYNLLSFPPDGTTHNSEYANVMTLRLSWDKSKYWHDIFASPNTKFLWHRYVDNGTANDWCRIVEESTDMTWGINISGNAATASNANAVNGVSLTWDGQITSSQWIAAWESGTSIRTMSAYNTFISMCSYLDEGSSDVTDGTMFITSYATDNGFSDPNGKNKPYKRKASLLWNYINNKCSSIYATQSWVNSNYYTCSESDSRYIQSETDPVWNAAKGNYYTKTESDNRYIRSETDPVWTAAKVNYYTKTECNNKFQPKGTYLTEQNLQGYATQEWVRGEEYLYRSGGTMDARAEIGITTKLFIGNSTSSDTCYTKFNCILHGGGDESNPNWVIRDNGYSEFKSSVSANAFYASSDIRLKNILDDINIDFDKLKLIPKKYYTWKGSDILQLGTIAQDIQKIYPEVVSKNENGYLSVDYSKLSIIALAAIDKLNERIKELECQIKL